MRMWAFITQLLVTLVLLGFFLVSCQNVMHIFKGSLCFVLKHIHQELDKELGENEALSDDEETISTRVIRRRVLLKVITRQEAGLELEVGAPEARAPGQRAQCCDVCRGVWGKAPDAGQETHWKRRDQKASGDRPSVLAEKPSSGIWWACSYPASVVKLHQCGGVCARALFAAKDWRNIN